MKEKDCEKMNERQLLRELVSRFVKYDRARDKYDGFLKKLLEKKGVDLDEELGKRKHDLTLDMDEKFCMCREIVRIVKKDPDYMWC